MGALITMASHNSPQPDAATAAIIAARVARMEKAQFKAQHMKQVRLSKGMGPPRVDKKG
jgi:hypothetical protein